MDRQSARESGSTVGDRSTDGGDANEATAEVSVDRGGIDVFDALFVRQEIREGRTRDVLDLLADWATAIDDGDARTLLPVRGVTLVTLFCCRGEDGLADELLWYLEVVHDGAEEWADPAATIRTASPLFDEGLGDLLDPGATVHGDGIDGRQLITHATHPRRQQRYADHCGRTLLAPVAGDDLPIDIAVTTVPLKPGLTSWLVGRVVAVGNWVKRFDRVSTWLREQTDTLEEEAMYTETLLLEPADGRRQLRYYMETESMDRLYDAYRETDNWDARFSDWAMRRIFEDPGDVLEYPLESDCEVLVHAVHPGRP